jgi:signal transduction histidine kinase
LLGYSEILAREYNELDRETIGKFASDINTVASKAHGLLENLLNWTRIQTDRVIFNPVEFNLHPIVEDIFHFNSENAKVKNITLVNNVMLTEMVYADVNMLSTVLRNLISNAIKFTDENGRISVTTNVSDDIMEISVTDNGMGMSTVELNNLFDENFQYSGTGTHNEKGTGLGLILCKEFVEKHGGTIKAESRLGEGTTITFTIKSHK